MWSSLWAAFRSVRCPNIWMPNPPSRLSTIRFFHGRRMICVVERRIVFGIRTDGLEGLA